MVVGDNILGSRNYRTVNKLVVILVGFNQMESIGRRYFSHISPVENGVIMYSEINGEMFLAITSEYSSIISFVMHNVYLPSRKSCQTL